MADGGLGFMRVTSALTHTLPHTLPHSYPALYPASNQVSTLANTLTLTLGQTTRVLAGARVGVFGGLGGPGWRRRKVRQNCN